MQEVFSQEHGLRFGFARVPMNSNGFSDTGWACCEVDGDTQLEHFTIERYRRSIIPMIWDATQAAGSPLKLIASPWSPPGWMKESGCMTRGSKLKGDCKEAWARYYVRFAEDLAALGLPLWAFTVQNEPTVEAQWESCQFTAKEECSFISNHLGPALASSNLDVKLLVWDQHRAGMLARAMAAYSDARALDYIWGVAFHWDGSSAYTESVPGADHDCYQQVKLVHELRPDRHLIMTEAGQEGGPHIGDWNVAERYGENIIKDLNNWCEAWLDSNILLDVNGGPNHAGRCCAALVHVDIEKDLLFLQPSFDYIGHFSHHILPGAQRIMAAANRDALETTAFVNTDGMVAVVVLNRSSHNIEFNLEYIDHFIKSSVPMHSIATYTFLLDGKNCVATDEEN